MKTFNHERLSLARKRRQLTLRRLGELSGLTPSTLTRLEKGEREPEAKSVQRLADVLGYPEDFFYSADLPELNSDSVSFRSFARMSAAQKHASEAAGCLGIELVEWLDRHFQLPQADLPEMDAGDCASSPEEWALWIRNYWGIGARPIGSMIDLLEAKGVRVLSMDEETAHVNAFSFWRDDVPYVFLNTYKTAESSVFDAAHELGHLLMHREGVVHSDKVREAEADRFASSFLMPEMDVRAHVQGFVDVPLILKSKKRWNVSAFAFARRLKSLGMFFSDDHYRRVCIELTRRGFRKSEPGGVDRQTSKIWNQVITHLWKNKMTFEDIARQLCLPPDEVQALIMGLLTPKKPEQVAEKLPSDYAERRKMFRVLGAG